MDTQSFLADKYTIFKGYAGSVSYGTNLPTSDVDIRGLFCADPINIRTPFFRIREVEDGSEEDTKLYELSHFLKLCLDCNPNIIEMLWLDDVDIIQRSPGYDLLRANRATLLSARIAFTTSGYAMAQLKRIKGHNKWITNPQSDTPPRQMNYLSLIQWYGKARVMPRDFNPEMLQNDTRLIPYGNHMFGLYHGVRSEVLDTTRSQMYAESGSLNTIFDGKREKLPPPLALIKFNKDEYLVDREKHKNYWTWRGNRNKVRSELEHEHGYDCYSDDTEFLTSDGWKLFDDVTSDDVLATFDQLSHHVEYQKPTERIDSLYTGNMYNFLGHHSDTLVTANHHMFLRTHSRSADTTSPWCFIRAGELPETFDTLRHITPKKNRQTIPDTFNPMVLQHVDFRNYLRILGWYISDGTAAFYKSGKVKNIMISQSTPQSKLTQTLSKQRNNNKITCKHYTYEANNLGNYPENRWIFSAPLAGSIVDDCGHGSKTKRIPSWCFALTRREMTTLIVALIQGDGSKKDHKNHTYVYYSVNSLLADDVQRLSVLCGYETSKYGPYDNDMCHVYINMRPTKSKRTTRDRVVKTPVANKRVVCFMVPNLTLITRRNGQLGFHGNTKHAMHLVRLMRMGQEALEHGHILVKRPDAQELLDIRAGKWTYNELLEYATYMDHDIRENWYKKTALPKNPNFEFAAYVLMEIQDMIWQDRGVINTGPTKGF